jgi:hypothetical protein
MTKALQSEDSLIKIEGRDIKVGIVYPASLTMMSRPLKRSRAVLTMRSPKSAADTLPTHDTASPPSFLISAITSSAGY